MKNICGKGIDGVCKGYLVLQVSATITITIFYQLLLFCYYSWYNLSYPPPSTSSAFCYLSRSSTWPVAVMIPIQTTGKFQRSFMDYSGLSMASVYLSQHYDGDKCLSPPDHREALLWVIIWICTCGGKRSSKAVAKIGLVAVN